MNALTKAMRRSDGFALSVQHDALRMKQTGELAMQVASDALGGFGGHRDQARNKQRYGLNRGWLYSAINALAMKGASQPVNVGRMVNVGPGGGERRGLGKTKAELLNKMPPAVRRKAVQKETELLEDHPLADALERPNKHQNRWQFVYTFIANLNLTGKAYVVRDEFEGKLQFYALPTTWVSPAGSGKEGKYSKYRIRNPKRPESEGETIPAEFVAVACLPDPSDPVSALAPSGTQINAIRIDDHLQASQERFFENGIFPGVIVTVGRDPHPDVPAGVRPRLTASQRRQVYAAIRKMMGGVANSGNPAIVDGVIEKIERLSMASQEMGWDKSEDKVKQRILSAFAVNPFVLGEKAPSSYAQAYVTMQLFNDRVNTFLDMLGCVMNEFASVLEDDAGRLVVWWDRCESTDPAIRANMLSAGRKTGDITRNEYRAELGYPAMEEDGAKRSPLLDTVGGITGAGFLLAQVAKGNMTLGALSYLLSLFLQIPPEEIERGLGGGGVSKPSDEERMLEVLREAVESMKCPVELAPSSVRMIEEMVVR